ncbi:putative bifunctional diguanylate cyclase/phosphodiesterase [Phenylobacterium sp.]|uniref:putative bifunctional diguanylate cyclase/phosphodiesterase n=1 Tax=Phenylobacterium sp. TaxID=1871053 RepID=UPI0030023BF7
MLRRLPLGFARLRRRARPWLTPAAVVVMVALAMASGLLRPIEEALASQRFQLIQREASQQIAIVEIDAVSLKAAATWPWGRERYAQALDNLEAAGAVLIGFDVDFSARSTLEGDDVLARSISRHPGQVILPTFVQPTNRNDPGAGLVENAPLAALSRDALLASVNVPVDAAGRARAYLRGFGAGETYRPTMATLMAGQPPGRTDSFLIDYGIDPRSTPQLSFQDVYDNSFDPALVRGRAVLIGATALELGDNLATPRHGVLPGVVVHALAFESLIQGRALYGLHPLACLILVLALALALRPSAAGGDLTALSRRHIAAIALILGLPIVLQAVAPISMRVAPLLVAQALCLALTVRSELRRRAEAIVREREAGLLHLALHESETELPNRRALLKEVARIRSGHDGAAAVVVVGLDRHAEMRAAIGYSLANHVLRAVAERLLRTCHASRLGYLSTGVLGLVVRRADLATLESELAALEALDPAYEVQGHLVDAFTRLGVAYDTDPGESDEVLLEQATRALDEARRLDRRRLTYAPEAFQDPSLNLALMSELRQGLAEGQISLYYQPKTDAVTGVVTGLEALMRWRHPVRGAIRPDLFIPAAEETGSIRELTEWTLAQALADSETLRASGHNLRISINVSGRVLSDHAFCEHVLSAVRGRAAELCVEITETAVIESPQAAIEAVSAFRKAGLAISIDDYGVGLSSLSYLKMLEADELKLDRSIATAVDTERDRLILKSTIKLAHSLGMKVVAEGVETEATRQALAGLGCDLIQGYLVAAPMPLDALAAFLAPEPRLAASVG